MKLYASYLLLLLPASADAFALAPTPVSRRTSTLLQAATSVNSADAVKAAKEASEKFGPTSPEARIAWELVEEIDSNNSRDKQTELAKEQQEKAAAMLEQVEPCAEPAVRRDNSEAVQMALEASELYGKDSKQARLAWSIVEELDAANSRHRPEDIHVLKEEECSTEPRATMLKKTPPASVEEAIEQATLATQVYGKHSVDARMAWELVEEMDVASSDIRAAKVLAEQPKVAEESTSKKAFEGEEVYKDVSGAIKAALEASKTHGATSVEARIAWELVEEIDAANSHHKTVGSG